MIGVGTIINTVAVLVGGALGTALGARLPEKVRETVMHGLGLVVLAIGVHLSLKTTEILIVLGSVLLGGILGELLRIEDRINDIGRWIELRGTRNPRKTRKARNEEKGAEIDLDQPEKTSDVSTTQFSRAFLTASLVFCVGPMTILGSFQDGLEGNFEILAIKSALDFFAAMAFASTMGPGVIAAALTVVAYQGALTLGAGWASGVLTDPMIAEMTATGGVLMLAIGLGLLELKKIRTGNLLPAILIAPIIVAVVEWAPKTISLR
ncbi:MAG: DUF554 domain-containing protein [Anaerolineae bacterium]|nr:DUF554 domain-containing protein [Anaerolineae bacterium]